jgi:hypothetical protein
MKLGLLEPLQFNEQNGTNRYLTLYSKEISTSEIILSIHVYICMADVMTLEDILKILKLSLKETTEIMASPFFVKPLKIVAPT